jgi:hypothetical protein
MSLFEVSKYIVRIVFNDHVLHVYPVIARRLGNFKFEGIFPEVVASFVSSLK